MGVDLVMLNIGLLYKSLVLPENLTYPGAIDPIAEPPVYLELDIDEPMGY